MGVFNFEVDADDLEPFPRKLLKTQARDSEDEIKKVKDLLKAEFDIKDWGQLMFFLGIEVIRTDVAVPVKNARQNSNLLSQGQHQVSGDNKEELLGAQDSGPANGSVQEASNAVCDRLMEFQVTVIGEDLVFARDTIQLSWLELKFLVDLTILKFFDDCGNLIAINLPVNKITGFGLETCQQTAKDLLRLTLTKAGIELLKQHLKDSFTKLVLSCGEDFSVATRLKKFNGSCLAKEITSLSDRYKVLWRPRQLSVLYARSKLNLDFLLFML